MFLIRMQFLIQREELFRLREYECGIKMKIRYPSGEEIDLPKLRERLVMYCQDDIIAGIFNGRIFPLLAQKEGHAFGTLISIIGGIEEELEEEENKFLTALRDADRILFELHQSDYKTKPHAEKDQMEDAFADRLAPTLDVIIGPRDLSCVRYVELSKQGRYGYMTEKRVFIPLGLNIVDDEDKANKSGDV